MATVEVRIGEWIKRGWQLYVEEKLTWSGAILISSLLTLAPVYYASSRLHLVSASTGYNGQQIPHANPQINPSDLLFLLGVQLVTILIGIFLSGGLYRMALKQSWGESISILDILSGADCFFYLLGADLLVTIIFLIGAVFCLLPGIIAIALLFLTFPLVVDQRVNPVKAMAESFNICKQNIIMFTLFVIILGIILVIPSFLGSIFFPFYLGILIIHPLAYTVPAVAYGDCFGGEEVGSSDDSFDTVNSEQPDFYASPKPVPAYGGAVQTGPSCPHCGVYLPSFASFCAKCGRKR